MSKRKEHAPVYEGEQSGTKRLPVPDEMVCICRFLLHCLYTAVKKKTNKQRNKKMFLQMSFFISIQDISVRESTLSSLAKLEFIGWAK